jgi:hypothetical protein
MTQSKRLFTSYNKDGELVDADHDVAPSNVFKQELVTWVETEFGLKRTIVTRVFSDGTHMDSVCSEPIVLNKKTK